MAGGGDDAAAGGSVLVVTPTHATAASTQRPSQTTDTVETVKKAKEGSMRGEGSGGLHAVLGAMDRSLYPLRLFFFGSVAVACAYTCKHPADAVTTLFYIITPRRVLLSDSCLRQCACVV